MTNQDFTPHAALVPILEGLFDYAGLFPPASLNMEAAAEEYLEHLAGPERTMVGPFVVPSARLDDMRSAFEAHETGTTFTLLPRSGQDELDADLRAAKRLEEQSGEAFRCVAVEIRLPDIRVDAAQFASMVRIALEKSGLTPEHVFLEIPRGDDFEDRLAPYFDALTAASGKPLFAGKLRCGGPTPADHPSSREIAQFILAGIRARCPFKFTAGLHHPFRHFSTDPEVIMHGFVNVMVATAIGAAIEGPLKLKDGPVDGDDLPPGVFDALSTTVAILEEYTPQMFRAVGNQIRWKEFRLEPDALRQVRSELALGIGSCSIKEPLDDLSHYFSNYPT